MKARRPFGDDDFVLAIILWVIVILGFIILAVSWSNNIVNAAYRMSEWVTQGQIEKAEDLGAIKRTQLEVVNNYGEQDTFNPQVVGENR